MLLTPSSNPDEGKFNSNKEISFQAGKETHPFWARGRWWSCRVHSTHQLEHLTQCAGKARGLSDGAGVTSYQLCATLLRECRGSGEKYIWSCWQIVSWHVQVTAAGSRHLQWSKQNMVALKLWSKYSAIILLVTFEILCSLSSNWLILQKCQE